jgi:hypothetical protein
MNAPQPSLYRTPRIPGFMGSYNWAATMFGLVILRADFRKGPREALVIPNNSQIQIEYVHAASSRFHTPLHRSSSREASPLVLSNPSVM